MQSQSTDGTLRGARPTVALKLLVVTFGLATPALFTAALGTGAASSALSPMATKAAPGARAGTARVVHLTLIGKIDAASGKPGTFTGRPGWPAIAPSNIRVPAGATVVLTIKEHDDMATALPTMGMMGSMFNRVWGGTETVDGRPVTSVSNARISHTLTVPRLGINVPLPRAPRGGVTTVVFTFKSPTLPGTYVWQCETPCGSGPSGRGGAMATDGWMRGRFAVT